ncbi:MAG: hypothetical protein AAB906_02800 [Patescibacteria group bacterium]
MSYLLQQQKGKEEKEGSTACGLASPGVDYYRALPKAGLLLLHPLLTGCQHKGALQRFLKVISSSSKK